MSLSALVNGADCGPVNPLQGLSKQLDRDRGIQQDHFGSSHAGPSRQTFRSQPQESSRLAQEAGQFFSNNQPGRQLVPSAFDLSSLNGALTHLRPSSMAAQQARPQVSTSAAPPAWALDFKQAAFSVPQVQTSAPSAWASDFGRLDQPEPSTSTAPVHYSQQPMMNNYWPAFQTPQLNPSFARPVTDTQQPLTDWASQFASVEEDSLPATISAPKEARALTSDEITVDDLSETAALLISTVQHETNPKFQNSEFMGLMKRLKDRQVVVEGNDMVDMNTHASYVGKNGSSGWADEFAQSAASSANKGKGRAVDQNEGARTVHFEQPAAQSFDPRMNSYMDHLGDQRRIGDYYRGAMDMEKRHLSSQQDRASVLREFSNEQSQEDDEGPVQLGKDYLLRDQSNNGASLAAEWGRLQADWDEFEATTTGIVPVGEVASTSASQSYVFQENNPYMLAGGSSTRHHSMHSRQHSLPYQSVLQTEAEVQRDPTNARAWFELGVKQQENEREDKAIQALNQAVELDPSHLAAWLALSVSYTNENDRDAALTSISRWIDVNEPYKAAVAAHRALNAENIEIGRQLGSLFDRQKELVECLMTMARNSPDGQVDAEIQIALGVLLNTSEDYDKAQDCFQTALAVRPDDWLLYNRVGATLANNGKAADALEYYYRALELNPSYIRARFNLGISCINLRMFEEATQHILDALVLQEHDASPENGSAGLSASTLWDSLKNACVHLQRPDLVALCEAKDLNGFSSVFQVAPKEQDLNDVWVDGRGIP